MILKLHLIESANNCLNTEAKEWLWEQMLKWGNIQEKRNEFEHYGLREKPFDYHISDELLAACVNNNNERIRAMGQHIWFKTGKSIDEQIFEKWANDSNFVIRANAVLVKPEKISDNDPSTFVRLIKNLNK